MTFIAIGGAEDKQGDMTVLKRVLAESGKDAPRICVITTATAYPDDARQRYIDAFAKLGIVPDVQYIDSRAMAAADTVVASVSDADVVFFSGGDQSRLTGILAATPVMDIIAARYAAEDLIVAGTSAGAAAASTLMLTGGDPERGMQKGEVPMTAGFGFIQGVIIDTHFSERNRLSRLFNAVVGNPAIAGIGIDEDTAMIARKDGTLEIVGTGTVTIVNGRNITASNFTAIEDGEEIVADGVEVTRLASGQKFSLSQRRVI